jgi:predicted RNA-binding Zn-ribbon protein involved in translation (DUF1610 family)
MNLIAKAWRVLRETISILLGGNRAVQAEQDAWADTFKDFPCPSCHSMTLVWEQYTDSRGKIQVRKVMCPKCQWRKP